MTIYSANLYPDNYASGTGSWYIDDPAEIQRVTTSTNPSIYGTGLYADHRDDGDQVRYTLDQVDAYANNFNYIAIHIFQDGPPLQQMSVKVRFEHFSGPTFIETSFEGNTYSPQWQTAVLNLGGITYSASEINALQLWLTAPNPCGEFQIYSVYLEVIGELSYSQFDPDNFVRIGDCAGLNATHLYGGLILNGEAVVSNAKIRYADGGLKLGDLQPRIADGGLILESEIEASSSIRGKGGVVVGGTAGVQTINNETSTGGVIIGAFSYANGYKIRLPITVFAADEAELGVVLGYGFYLPAIYSSYETYRVEDEEGNQLAYEVVSREGNRISLFVKVNLKTEDQTIYFYAK